MQTRFYHQDERLLSPVLFVLTLAIVASAASAIFTGSFVPLGIALTILGAVMVTPEQLIGPWWSRTDAWFERRAPTLIDGGAIARRWIERVATALRVGAGLLVLVVVVPTAVGYLGGPDWLAYPLVAFNSAGPAPLAIAVLVVELALCSLVLIPFDLSRSRRSAEELALSPMITCAEVAAGLRRACRGDIALAISVLGLVLASGLI